MAIIGWVGIRGYLAKGELETAQVLVSQLKSDASGMKLEALGPTLDELSARSENARALTSDPVWRALEFVPVVGRNLAVVRELAAATDDTVAAVTPLVAFASTLDPAVLAPVDGAVPIKPFEDLVPIVQQASDDLVAIEARATAIDASQTLGPVAAAREKFVSLLGRTVPSITQASKLVPLVPSLLGRDGPKNYVVMFQNNAEVRSLGGTALSFALITIDHGKISLEETVPAGLKNFPQLSKSIIPVPDGVKEFMPEFGRFIANATVRPSFPSAGAIVYENWRKARDVRADGVISLDAVALSYVLKATGPIEMTNREPLDSTNVVKVLLNHVLQQYNTGDLSADNAAQDAVYSEAVAKTFGRLAGGQFTMPTLLLSIFQGFNERRFSYWSSQPTEQALIEEAGLANELETSNDKTDIVGL